MRYVGPSAFPLFRRFSPLFSGATCARVYRLYARVCVPEE